MATSRCRAARELIDRAQHDVTKAIRSGALAPEAEAAYARAFGRDPAAWRDASAIAHVAAGRGIFAERLRGAGVAAERIDAPEASRT